MSDFSNFLEIQMNTAWGKTLAGFASFAAPKPASVILDIGCGPGLLPLLFACAGHKAIGLDFDFALLAQGIGGENPAAALVNADAFYLPLQLSTFNLITSTNLLFLLDDPRSALKTWRRLLAPEGEICLLNPSEHMSVAAATQLADGRGLSGTARTSLLSWAHNAETYARWTEGDLQSLFAQADMELVETTLRVGPGFARLARARLC